MTLGSNAAGSHHATTENFGGAIANMGNLTVNNSTFTSNTAHAGGGIENNGTLAVSDSTFNGNSATSYNFFVYGGGIDNNGTLTVSNTPYRQRVR